jgi:putative transcriptional regulator
LVVKETCHKGGGFLKNRVEQLRKAQGLNQDEFAKKLRVSRQTISSIETGKYNPSLELAFAISKFFGKPIEEIFICEGGTNYEEA